MLGEWRRSSGGGGRGNFQAVMEWWSRFFIQVCLCGWRLNRRPLSKNALPPLLRFFLLLILFTSFFFFIVVWCFVFQYFGLWCFLLPLDDDEYLEAFGLTKNLISSNHSEIKVSFLFNIFPFLFCCSCQLLLSLIFSFVVVLLFLLPELKKRHRWRFVFSVVSSLVSSTWAAVADAIGCRRACTCLFHIIF